MNAAWQEFVRGAIEGERDDPFVRLLRQRLGSGYKVVRVNLAVTARGPIYTLLLSHLRQLSKLDVPHSPSFTRWALANAIRMASREEEEERWALLAAERFEPVADDLGPDYANLVLLERLRRLAPPHTSNAIGEERATRIAPGREQARAIDEVDAFLGSLARDIGGALRYPPEEAAVVLDGALDHFVRRLADVSRKPAMSDRMAGMREAQAARRGAR